MHIIHWLATVVLALRVQSGFDFKELPYHVQDKIINEHVTSVTDLCHVSFSCCHLMSMAGPRIVLALFEPRESQNAPLLLLINSVSALIRFEPACRQLVEDMAPHLVLGLYHRIMWQKQNRGDLLRRLLCNWNLSVLSNEASARFEGHSEHEYLTFSGVADMLLSVKPSLPVIPDTISKTITKIIDEKWEEYEHSVTAKKIAQSRARGDHDGSRTALRALRQGYREPFLSMYPYNVLIAQDLLKSFDRNAHPLIDARVVLALRHYGLVFPLSEFFKHMDVRPEIIPDLVPLLQISCLDSIIELIDDLVQRGGNTGPEQALALLRIPFIQQEIIDSPARLTISLYYLLDMELRSTDFFTELVELPFMPVIVRTRFYDSGSYSRTLVYSAIAKRRYDIGRVLMRIPHVPLYQLNGRDSIFLRIIREMLPLSCEDDARRLLESSEFTSMVLSDIPQLISALQVFISRCKKWYGSEDKPCWDQLRTLLQLPFYCQIPSKSKAQLLDYAQRMDSTAFNILSVPGTSKPSSQLQIL